MIIPSIDIMNGEAVQLVGGKTMALNAGDPHPLAEKFGMIGEVAVIDLDAALGQVCNAPLIQELCQIAPCRVGGGIRDLETATRYLDRGAAKVILGTKAEPEILSQLPKDRVMAALDAKNGQVMLDGWRTPSGFTVEERLRELKGLVSGFLLTCIEREGQLTGIDMPRIKNLAALFPQTRLTIAGGVRDEVEIAALDKLGIDAQVGMAIYTNAISLESTLCALLSTAQTDGLYPTVVTDECGMLLGLAYSSAASLRQALETHRGVYSSRKRGTWLKGETSGATQELLRVSLDCDRDALCFQVRQKDPGFCHLGSRSCFGEPFTASTLARNLEQRRDFPVASSWTNALFNNQALLSAKLIEEAEELGRAGTKAEVIAEGADLMYFLLTKLVSENITLAHIEKELRQRSLRVTRRPQTKGELRCK